jgi:glycosyltransferase involved in cell wall biosynthesis
MTYLSISVKKKVFVHIPDGGSQGWYRAVAPVQHCRDELAAEGIELVASESLETFDFDAFIFHRAVQASFLPVVAWLKQQGKRICWELDDDIRHIPAWNPASKAYTQAVIESCDRMADLADTICVSTPVLAQVVNRPGKTVVTPNLIDTTQWPKPGRCGNFPLRIVWAGSAHHEQDLEEISEPLERVLAEYEDVRVFFFGAMPEKMGKRVRLKNSLVEMLVPKSWRVGFIEHVALEDYIPTLMAIQPDIALCPLCDHEFNNSKSGIKFMEMAMAGSAVIATSLPPYHYDGPFGLLVKPGDKKGWYEALKLLIEDAYTRNRLAVAGRRKVVEDHSWQSPAKEIWLNFFRSI